MKAYVLATGTVFLLIVVAHVLRAFEEGAGLLREPAYLLTSALALGFLVWAVILFRRMAPGR